MKTLRPDGRYFIQVLPTVTGTAYCYCLREGYTKEDFAAIDANLHIPTGALRAIDRGDFLYIGDVMTLRPGHF